MDATGAQLLHHLAVVRLVKKGADALRHRGPYVVNDQQLLFRSVHDRVDLAKVARQRLGRGLAHVADAQAKQEARQGGFFGFFQRVHNVLRRLVCHAVQRGQGGKPQAVQIGQRADQAGVHQLVHQLFAQAFDLNRAALGEMQYRLLALGAAKQAAGAAVVGLALFAHGR